MPDLILDFSAYTHVPRHYFPRGQLTFKADENGNFRSVKVAFVEPGKTMQPCTVDFTNRSKVAIELLGVVRTCCGNARTSGDIILAAMMGRATIVPLPVIAKQIIDSGIAFRILGKVIVEGRAVDPRSVELS